MIVKTYCLLGLLLLAFFLYTSNNYAQTASLDATLSIVQVDGINIPVQNGFALPSFEKQNRKILDLKGEWKKERFAANDNVTLAKRDATGYTNLINEANGRNNSSYDDSGWELKSLPSVENQINTYPAHPEFYQDGVWYRKTFIVDNEDSGKFVKLMFYAVNYVADVWINDVYMGYHEGGYTPFAFDVTSVLNYGGENSIAIRVDNPAWGSRNDIVPYTQCDWFNYTGVIHDVYLEFSSPVSVIRDDIIPLTLGGDIQTTIVLNNITDSLRNIDVAVQIFEASINTSNIQSEFSYELIGNEIPISGITQYSINVPADSVTVRRTNLKIDSPKLWTPKTPNLYIARVTVKEGNNTIDEFSSQFGIRIVKSSGNKFLLNDKVVFFTGAARHEDHPLYGRSIPKDEIFNDLQIVKNTYVNFLRTAHYPNNPYTYLVADRLGIATMQEIPVFWFDTAQAWQIQNNTRHIHEQMFREMIFKDYNRPSVVLWSTCNECLDVSNRKLFIAKMNDDLDNNFPDGRLVTQSAAADRPGATDDSQNACDVSGWTMYFGIFHGSTYFVGTYNFINDAKTYNSNKPIIDTEFGYWSSEDNSSEQTQVDVFNNTFLAFKQHAALNSAGEINSAGPLMASTWWCMFDWYRMSNSNQTMGLYSMDRTYAKPVVSTLKNAYGPYFNFDGVTDVPSEKLSVIPQQFILNQNYPNPFNPGTIINWQSPVNGRQILKVYDILGNEIGTLVDEYKEAGNYEIEFNINDIFSRSLPSGVYIYQLRAGEYSATKKMILLK